MGYQIQIWSGVSSSAQAKPIHIMTCTTGWNPVAEMTRLMERPETVWFHRFKDFFCTMSSQKT